jgi:hypothetical protein
MKDDSFADGGVEAAESAGELVGLGQEIRQTLDEYLQDPNLAYDIAKVLTSWGDKLRFLIETVSQQPGVDAYPGEQGAIDLVFHGTKKGPTVYGGIGFLRQATHRIRSEINSATDQERRKDAVLRALDVVIKDLIEEIRLPINDLLHHAEIHSEALDQINENLLQIAQQAHSLVNEISDDRPPQWHK